MIFAPVGISTRTVFKSIPAPHVRISKDERLRMQKGARRKRDSAQPQEKYAAINKVMIRHYTAMGLQSLGLILTGEALLLYFGQMGPLMKTASLGAGLFYAGRFLQARR